MKLINLTENTLPIVTASGVLEIPPSGEVAELETHHDAYKIIEPDDGHSISIEVELRGDIINLPEPQPDTFYIVSSIVAHAANRRDVVYPGRPARDEKGNVIGIGELLVPKSATVIHRDSRTAEILRLDGQGMKQKHIAAALGITPQAVSDALKRHRQNTAFSNAERCLIIDAMNGTEGIDGIPYQFRLMNIVWDAVLKNGLDRKYKVDRDTISAKLQALTETEAKQLYMRVESYWDGVPYADDKEGLRAAGLL